MRKEEDFIGEVEVPDEAYYGSFTVRASSHFKLSGMLVDRELTYAVALIKKAAAQANGSLGAIEQSKADAIERAADEVISGKLDKEFILDAYQAGAGTPLHMNVNEVIANLAEEMLGGKKGEYAIVHPNNHVNMSQSSNDVVPTAARLAAIKMAAPVLSEGELFHNALLAKAEEYKSTMKIGRTHLQDAVPMTYGQTFAAWARAIEKDLQRIEEALECVAELGIGGTATGSGINTHPRFREEVVERLNETGLFMVRLKCAEDTVGCAAQICGHAGAHSG
ncbi:MAG: lyase family protein [Candidatus Micrarchaeota archaeon]